jgi:tetratricopeptide (TPR) repeat protein
MLRRHLIALGGAAMAGAPVARLGELLPELPAPPPVPLPSQLSNTQLAQVRDLTRRLDRATVTLGSSPEVSSAATTMAERLLSVPGPEQIRRALLIAVAELHIQAGWAGFDAGLYEQAMHHYARALELGTEAGDAYLQALVLNYAGLATVEHGHPDDGLKMLQCARVKAWDIPRQSREVVIGEGSRVAVEACGLADSATALAALGQPEAAYRHLGMSRELWLPASGAAAGDLDRPAAWLEVRRGRLDVAQQLATSSARRWQDVSRVGHTTSGILLATIHVKAGERDGPQLAHQAISAVAQLTSVRVRRQLAPLAEALAARPGSEAAALAGMAHQLAATRT